MSWVATTRSMYLLAKFPVALGSFIFLFKTKMFKELQEEILKIKQNNEYILPIL